ncbi:chromate transporter [Staphylospora marina]|uniref:chromate transporter n=1 Tax=Staphylospora marina TaxID=2490858 RepID=UPI001F14A3AB|nr:chromate transporter [Staphylospora marina]
MLQELFFTFFKIGFLSFGGGYAMIPVLEHEAVAHGWTTTAEFSEWIAVAGMAPGPIALNAAVSIGYHQAGLAGALVSLLGMVLPSLSVAFALSAVLVRIGRHPVWKKTLQHLMPVIVGLILFAAWRFAVSNFSSVKWEQGWMLLLIFAASLTGLIRYRLHPALVILGAGIVGAAFLGD